MSRSVEASSMPHASVRMMIYAFLTVFSILTLIPFFWLFTASIKNSADFFQYLFFPVEDGFPWVAVDRLSFQNFVLLFTEHHFSRAIMNSTFYASVTSLLGTLFAAMSGYALAKFEFRGRGFFTNWVLAALIIPAPLLLAPGYELLYHLGMLNSFWGLILPGLAPAFGVFLFRQAMLNTVPSELLESARIDGAGEIRIFFSIVLPLIRPMMGAFMMITFLGAWNNFIQPQVVMQSQENFPLAVAIAHLRGYYTPDWGLITSGTIVSIAPPMVLFLLLQKEYLSGLTSGAVKG